MLGTITGGLIPSHDQRVATQAGDASTNLANVQAGQLQGLQQQGVNTAQNGVNTLQSLGANPLLGLYQTGQTNNPLLQMFGQAAGINLPGSSTPPGYIPGTPGGGFNNGVPSVGRPTGSPANAPQTGAQPSNTPGTGSNPSGANTPLQAQMDAYGLTGPQQVQLNQQLDRLTKQSQSHISQFTSHMAGQGIDPSLVAEGAQRLQAEYSGLQQGAIANFAESARQAKEQALQSLISAGSGAYGQQQQFGESQQQLGMNTQLGATTALSNPQAAQNQIAQQAAASQQASLGSLLQLGGYAAGGGFNPLGALQGILGGGGGTPPIVGSTGLGASGQGF